MEAIDLQEIHDTLITVAHEAGRMMLSANPADIDKGTKLNCKSSNLSSLHLFPSPLLIIANLKSRRHRNRDGQSSRDPRIQAPDRRIPNI